MKKSNNIHFIFIGTLILQVLISLNASAQKKISCVGNSITYGYALSNPSSQSYPGQMQEMLGTTDWKVENFGSSGRTLLKAGGYSYWDDQRYKDALASSPDLVIIKLGTNDSKRWLWDWKGHEFKNDYQAMIESFQNLSNVPEIWIGLLIPGENSDWDIFNAYINEKVNPKIEEVALEMGVGLIDLYTVLNEKKAEWYLDDNVHPSVAGAGVIATTIKDVLLMTKPDIDFDNNKVIAPDGAGYQWYIDGIPVLPEDSGDKKEMEVVKSGAYKVSLRLSVDNHTRIVSNEMYISGTNHVAINKVSNDLKIYPNPTPGFIRFQLADFDDDTSFMIVDMAGKIVQNGKISGSQGEIRIDSLSAGAYTLQIKNKRIKIIKQ
ncbi:MAG: T9SS type A sorting domain-containing protein [Prolixibacteraceae bacterium]|nr:T9SS type A sorting domain-containing protein [Prolixibacteraceae bacterium]